MPRTFGTAVDPRSTEELLRFAVAAKTRRASRKCMLALGFREPELIFPFAERLCQSESLRERLVGAEIVGRLGSGYFAKRYTQWAARMFLDMLRTATNPLEIRTILKWMANQTYICTHIVSRDKNHRSVVKLAYHSDAKVRLAAVCVLMHSEKSLATLLQLMHDPSPRVRDWATFAVGTILPGDSTDIRDALAERLNDRDQDTFAEAVYGLARRRDDRVYDVLLAEFQAGEPTSLLFDAAIALGDKRLLPRLEELLVPTETDESFDRSWIHKLRQAIIELRSHEQTAGDLI